MKEFFQFKPSCILLREETNVTTVLFRSMNGGDMRHGFRTHWEIVKVTVEFRGLMW